MHGYLPVFLYLFEPFYMVRATVPAGTIINRVSNFWPDHIASDIGTSVDEYSKIVTA